MDVYLHFHFSLHGVVHIIDAALFFTGHYCHVVSQKFRVTEVKCSGILSQLGRQLAAFVSVIKH
jgi:hypothetical protein